MIDDKNAFDADIYGLPVRNADDLAHGREPLEVLASEFVEALRQGRNPSVGSFADRHPELAEEITEVFPLLAAMEEWKDYKEQASVDHRLLGRLKNDGLPGLRILREIGRGGMGIVFEAQEEASRRHVAVKILPFSKLPRWRERFEREAETAARLRHPHIVPVFQHGVDDDICYYVMRLIKGVGLDWVIGRLKDHEGVVYADEIGARFGGPDPNTVSGCPVETGGRRGLADRDGPSAMIDGANTVFDFSAGRWILRRDAWRQIARIGAQVAGALSYAHSSGTLHGDIKPGNLLLDSSGVVWITDFGLARHTQELVQSSNLQIAGTLRYMAPEQFDGNPDERSDIYSLGITLYELLTRIPAFREKTRGGVMQSIAASAPVAPRLVNASIPDDLQAIVLKAIARDPSQRYRSAGKLMSDLLRFANGQSVKAGSTGPLSSLARWFRSRVTR